MYHSFNILLNSACFSIEDFTPVFIKDDGLQLLTVPLPNFYMRILLVLENEVRFISSSFTLWKGGRNIAVTSFLHT